MVTRVGPAGWLSAEQVDSDGQAAFRLNVNLVGGSGGSVTIAGPLGTQAAAAAVAVTLSTENLARFPASLGAKTSAASFSIVPASDASFAITAAQLPSTLGIKTAANSLSIAPASDASFAVTGPQTDAQFIAALKSATGTLTSSNSGTSPVTLLASNGSRKGATIANTDANVLYVLCSASGTVSATVFTFALGAGNTTPTDRDIPAGYTGAVMGLWAGDGAGVGLATEYT